MPLSLYELINEYKALLCCNHLVSMTGTFWGLIWFVCINGGSAIWFCHPLPLWLPCLPFGSQAQFKVLILTFKAQYGLGPQCLKDHLLSDELALLLRWCGGNVLLHVLLLSEAWLAAIKIGGNFNKNWIACIHIWYWSILFVSVQQGANSSLSSLFVFLSSKGCITTRLLTLEPNMLQDSLKNAQASHMWSMYLLSLFKAGQKNLQPYIIFFKFYSQNDRHVQLVFDALLDI